MPADRLLGTLLRSLQTYTDQQDTPRLLGTASSLLTTLNNPLNITLLTSQLLSSPAIWTQPEGLRPCMRTLSVFHSAAQALIKHENALNDKSPDKDFTQLQLERTLPKDDWVRAVVNGADEHSPRWAHLLILGGLLLGFGRVEDEGLSQSMWKTLESGLVTALNAALEETAANDALGAQCITLVLNHCFPFLSDHERTLVDYDTLLPVLMESTFRSQEGLRSAYFLGAVDLDVRPVAKSHFRWAEQSTSFQEVQRLLSSPLLSSLGPLSRLIGHSLEQTKQPWLVMGALRDLETFARTLHLQWRQNKLSEIDASEESTFLDKETVERTTPQLWKLLRSTMFGIVIILRSIVGRTLGDKALANDEVAPGIATQTLQILRNVYFISMRMGAATFSQYTFVSLSSMDILTAYPVQSEAFITSIKPTDPSSIPPHPLDRTLDLFFLNTAEHFTLTLSGQTSADLLIPAATPYLAAGGNNTLLPIFEAAHSLTLAVFSAPQNAALTTQHLPFYIDALFRVFPSNLSARQFRLAFKSLVQLTSPPSALAAAQPLLAATLLDLLHGRAKHASTTPLFPTPAEGAAAEESQPPLELSEQAVLTLTVADALTQVSAELLSEWLPLAADMVNEIADDAMREACKKHLWHVLVDGEMDPERSRICHAWWSTGGGWEVVLFGREEDPELEMSGGLDGTSRL